MQTENKQYESSVRHDGEDIRDAPNIARFVMEADDAKNILALSALVKENELHVVERFDYRVIYLQTNDDQDDAKVVNTDCDKLIVTDTEFSFSGIIKHTNVEVITKRFSICELVHHFGIGNASQESSTESKSTAMIDRELIHPKVVVLANNSNGEPEFFSCAPAVSHQEMIDGKHYELAKECASDNGFNGPMIAFDKTDAAARGLGEMLAWL